MSDCRGTPRTQYHRIVNVIPGHLSEAHAAEIFRLAWRRGRETVACSFDDAGIGDLDHRFVRIYGLSEEQKVIYTNWYDSFYPGVILQFVDVPPLQSSAPLDLSYLVGALPTHSKKKYPKRLTSTAHVLVIHHTTGGAEQSILNIASYHVNTRDWPGIGYHFVISGTGKIYQTNDLNTISYHAGQHNNYSVGIALQGNFTEAPPPEMQLNSTIRLIERLKEELDLSGVQGLPPIIPHGQMPGMSTACPGKTWPDWFPTLESLFVG